MGNNCSPSYQKFPEEMLEEEYYAFLEACCYESPEAYTNYHEFCILFSLFLQRQGNHQLELVSYLHRARGIAVPRFSDWDALASQFIDRWCRYGKIQRYGHYFDYPIVLGYRVLRLPVQRKWIEV
jgi:hypothetical protein